MKLSEHTDLELELLKQKINCLKFVNGLLAAVIIGGVVFAIVKTIGLFL